MSFNLADYKRTWIKSKLCDDCGFYVKPQLEDGDCFGYKNKSLVYFKCQHCEYEKAMAELAQWADDCAKKVIQKSDTKVTK